MNDLIKLIDAESAKIVKVSDDPVRPSLGLEFRISDGREIYALVDNERTPKAVICAAYTSDRPSTIDDLINFCDPNGQFVVFYTVWSYERGSGREIIFKTKSKIMEEKPNVKRYITLSPKTQMAYDFHVRNGASLLKENEVSYNFEYI